MDDGSINSRHSSSLIKQGRPTVSSASSSMKAYGLPLLHKRESALAVLRHIHKVEKGLTEAQTSTSEFSPTLGRQQIGLLREWESKSYPPPLFLRGQCLLF